jgi:hypothetical protein
LLSSFLSVFFPYLYCLCSSSFLYTLSVSLSCFYFLRILVIFCPFFFNPLFFNILDPGSSVITVTRLGLDICAVHEWMK